MTEREKLIETLQNRPILLNLKAGRLGTASGALTIPKDSKDIAFSYMRNSEDGFSTDSFSAVSLYGHFFISLGGNHSASGELFSRLNGQHEGPYDYILFSSSDNVVTSKTFNTATFRYHTFFDGVPVGSEDALRVSLFDHIKRLKRVCPAFRIDVRLSSSQQIQSFPYKKLVEYDKLDFVFKFTKPKTVDDVRATLHELNNYLTLFLQAPIRPNEIILEKTKKKNDKKIPSYCYLLERDMLSNAAEPTERKNAMHFKKQGKAFLGHLTSAIYYQDKFDVPLNLIRAYWVYKDKKVYLDNQVSVLLAAMDSLYDLVGEPSPRQQKRTDNYKNFIKQIESLEVPTDLKKWLTKAESFYTDPKAFSAKVKAVVEFADSEISTERAQILNDLRNDLMHGRFPEWESYISNYYEQRSGTDGDKVDLKWLAWVLSNAVLKLIKRTGTRRSAKHV